MKIWVMRLMAGAAALFVTAAPIALDVNHESVPSEKATSLALPCEGSRYGCKPATGWVCVIRSGIDCADVETREDKCNLDHDACAKHVEPPTAPPV